MSETRSATTSDSLVSLSASYSELSSRQQTLGELIQNQTAAIQRQAEESARNAAAVERMIGMLEKLQLPRADKQTTEAQPPLLPTPTPPPVKPVNGTTTTPDDAIDNFGSTVATGVFDLRLEVSPIDSTQAEVISVHSSSMIALSKKEIQNDKYGLEFGNKVFPERWCSPQPLKRAPIDFNSVLVLRMDDIGRESDEFESGTIISRSLNFCTEPVRQNVCEIFSFLLPPEKPPDECLSLPKSYLAKPRKLLDPSLLRLLTYPPLIKVPQHRHFGYVGVPDPNRVAYSVDNRLICQEPVHPKWNHSKMSGGYSYTHPNNGFQHHRLKAAPIHHLLSTDAEWDLVDHSSALRHCNDSLILLVWVEKPPPLPPEIERGYRGCSGQTSMISNRAYLLESELHASKDFGMIGSHMASLSLLFGAMLSWGVMWPLISDLKETWFLSNIPESSMKSLNGYRVFIAIALMLSLIDEIMYLEICFYGPRTSTLGDGVFIKLLLLKEQTLTTKVATDVVMCVIDLGKCTRVGWWNSNIIRQLNEMDDDTKLVWGFDKALSLLAGIILSFNQGQQETDEGLKRNAFFVRERIPMWIAGVGYVNFSIISIIAVPLMFHEVKWYYVVVTYLLAPALGFCNAYGASLTNMNMGYNYGKVALVVIPAMAGNHSGVVAGHIGCGLIKSIISICSDLTHDFKTGHLTLTSPRSMLVSQAIGTTMGCIAPLTFLLSYNAFDIGNPNGEYKAPYALIYHNMAILGVHDFSALPQHCLQLCYVFFGFSMASNLVRDFSPKPIAKCIHLPTAMAVPFLVEAYFAIDMCVVARCEIHHIIELDNQRFFLIMSTTNELYPGYIGVGQMKKLEIFWCVVITYDIKSNLFAKWLAQAQLACTNVVKLIFVSRIYTRAKFHLKFLVLAGFKREVFATQVTIWNIDVGFGSPAMNLLYRLSFWFSSPRPPESNEGKSSLSLLERTFAGSFIITDGYNQEVETYFILYGGAVACGPWRSICTDGSCFDNIFLDDFVSSAGYINHIFIFSLPRPPENVDLEDKVILKDGGMLRIGILWNLIGVIAIDVINLV